MEALYLFASFHKFSLSSFIRLSVSLSTGVIASKIVSVTLAWFSLLLFQLQPIRKRQHTKIYSISVFIHLYLNYFSQVYLLILISCISRNMSFQLMGTVKQHAAFPVRFFAGFHSGIWDSIYNAILSSVLLLSRMVCS